MSTLQFRLSDLMRYYNAANLGFLHFPVKGCYKFRSPQSNELISSELKVDLEKLYRCIRNDLNDQCSPIPLKDIISVYAYGEAVGESTEQSQVKIFTWLGLKSDWAMHEVDVEVNTAEFLVLHKSDNLAPKQSIVIPPECIITPDGELCIEGGLQVKFYPIESLSLEETNLTLKHEIYHGVEIFSNNLDVPFVTTNNRTLTWTRENGSLKGCID